MITLETSKWNRSGHLIRFIVASLTVFDDGLAAWRRANPDLTVRRPESVEAIVCASSFLDMSSEHVVVLTRPEERWARLERCATHLRSTALPWFAGSADPEHRNAAGEPDLPFETFNFTDLERHEPPHAQAA
ncbi:hypothetical protein AB0E88_27815 [Streptomyces sp. NPDC028635]|uniref:hypothetical protein n=1 Tax=Streptomyces sp. NPDC028635 TaxID=3154800 RepID=UPI0033D75725